MMRFLWVAVLLVSVGAEKVDPWKHNMTVFFDALTRDLNAALRKSLDYPVEPSPDGSYIEPSTARSTVPSTVKTVEPSTARSTVPSTVKTVEPSPVTTVPSAVRSTESSRILSTSTSYPEVHTPSENTDDYQPSSSRETTAQKDPMQVGSVRGVPGVNFPDYIDIPLTSFTCSNKDYIPGFYADMETGCQVFHVCWPHRRESFLCPVGTTFNQALLACDYWYGSNCSLAPHYYNVNSYPIQQSDGDANEISNTSSMINVLLGADKESITEQSGDAFSEVAFSNPDSAMSFISKFLPVKAKVTVYPGTADSPSKIVATASVGATKERKQYKQTHYSTTEKQSYHTSTDKIVSESKPSDQSPESSDKKYSNIEDSVIVILEEVSKTVRSIIQEAREILAARQDYRTPREKARPLTKLNPRFITKPVTLPKEDVQSPPTSRPTKTFKISGSTNYSVSYSKARVSKSLPRTQSSISPMTKKALTKNYLRLLKIRNA